VIECADINPKWYPITIMSRNIKAARNDAILMEGYGYFNVEHSLYAKVGTATFWISRKEDALIFKLKWGI